MLLVALRRRTRDRCLFLSIWDHLPRKFERKLRIRQRERERERENPPDGFLAARELLLPTNRHSLLRLLLFLPILFSSHSLSSSFPSKGLFSLFILYLFFIPCVFFSVRSSLMELLVSRHSHLSRLLAIQTRAPSNLSLPGRLVTPPTLDATLPPPISLSKGPTTWRFCFVFFFFVTPLWILIFLLDDPI